MKKIKTTNPENFLVKPNRGFLKASKTLEIEIQQKLTNVKNNIIKFEKKNPKRKRKKIDLWFALKK